jgi:hypothetical protein
MVVEITMVLFAVCPVIDWHCLLKVLFSAGSGRFRCFLPRSHLVPKSYKHFVDFLREVPLWQRNNSAIFSRSSNSTDGTVFRRAMNRRCRLFKKKILFRGVHLGIHGVHNVPHSAWVNTDVAFAVLLAATVFPARCEVHSVPPVPRGGLRLRLRYMYNNYLMAKTNRARRTP